MKSHAHLQYNSTGWHWDETDPQGHWLQVTALKMQCSHTTAHPLLFAFPHVILTSHVQEFIQALFHQLQKYTELSIQLGFQGE